MSFEIEAGVIAARITTLEGRADAQDIELAKIPAAIASAVDSATAPLIAQIALLESKVITLEAGVAALQAANGVERKAFQFNSSSQSFNVLTGMDLDTGGDNVLAPCTVLYACAPRDGTVDLIMGGTGALNNSPLIVRITSDKQRVYCGTGASSQKFSAGSETWANGQYHWGAATWDGTDIDLVFDGAVDSPSLTTTRSSSAQNHTGKLFLNDNGDNDCNEIVYIRGVLTLAQINSLKALLVAGDYEAAADVINGYNASAGCLVGPTADDDSTTVSGITEWCDGRTTVVQGSPALIDVPA